MARQMTAYDEAFSVVAKDPTMLVELEQVHLANVAIVKANAIFPEGVEPLQPNPWNAAHPEIVCTSKRYLTRLLDVYSEGYKSESGVLVDRLPSLLAEKAANRTVAELGGPSKVTFTLGPRKGEERIFEKVLNHREPSFDHIRDFCRGVFTVKDSEIMPKLIRKLGEASEFKLVRVKNRFSASYDSRDSAGYRDYQAIGYFPDSKGWLVEFQVVPLSIMQVKSDAGLQKHKDYRQYRFVIEAGRRARRDSMISGPEAGNALNMLNTISPEGAESDETSLLGSNVDHSGARVSGGALISGYLTKIGGIRRSWKRRYVELLPSGIIQYFKTEPKTSQEREKPQGVLDVKSDGVRVYMHEEVLSVGGKWPKAAAPGSGFGIFTRSARLYEFYSDSPEVSLEWIHYARTVNQSIICSTKCHQVLGDTPSRTGNDITWKITTERRR